MEGQLQLPVGRDAELETLSAFVEDLEPHPTALVMRSKEVPGIGKTTLLKTGIEMAAQLGYRVLRAGPSAIRHSACERGVILLLRAVYVRGVRSSRPDHREEPSRSPSG